MHKQKSLMINFVQKAHGIIWMPVIFLVNQRQGYLLDEWQHPGLKQYSVMRTDVMEASDKINPRWEVTFQECAAQLTNNCFLLMFYSLVKVIIYLCCFIFFQKQKTVDKREELWLGIYVAKIVGSLDGHHWIALGKLWISLTK